MGAISTGNRGSRKLPPPPPRDVHAGDQSVIGDIILECQLGMTHGTPPSSTMIPQTTAVVDLTCSEDSLSLKPGYAVGDRHARRPPHVHEAQRSKSGLVD